MKLDWYYKQNSGKPPQVHESKKSFSRLILNSKYAKCLRICIVLLGQLGCRFACVFRCDECSEWWFHWQFKAWSLILVMLNMVFLWNLKHSSLLHWVSCFYCFCLKMFIILYKCGWLLILRLLKSMKCVKYISIKFKRGINWPRDLEHS